MTSQQTAKVETADRFFGVTEVCKQPKTLSGKDLSQI